MIYRINTAALSILLALTLWGTALDDNSELAFIGAVLWTFLSFVQIGVLVRVFLTTRR